MELHQEFSYLKHFNGNYSVIFSFHFKSADVCNNNVDIIQLEIPETTYQILVVIKKSERKFEVYKTKLITGTAPQCNLSVWLNCKFQSPDNSCNFGQYTTKVTPSHIQHQEQSGHPSVVTFHNTFVAWPPLRPPGYLTCP